MSKDELDQKNKLLQYVLAAALQDKNLREQYQVGDKFKFIRDRLALLQQHIQEAVKEMEVEVESKVDRLAEDEMLVYVHLFNAQGLVFQSWQKMLIPSVFYEYSVNRPIYSDKAHVDAFLRSRPTKAQHAFLTVAIKKQDILPIPADTKPPLDPIGNPLLKIKEGSLPFKRVFSFTFQNNEYVIDAMGRAIKKEVQ